MSDMLAVFICGLVIGACVMYMLVNHYIRKSVTNTYRKYERDANGKWTLVDTWQKRMTPEEDAKEKWPE